jgi:hypothetical protein
MKEDRKTRNGTASGGSSELDVAPEAVFDGTPTPVPGWYARSDRVIDWVSRSPSRRTKQIEGHGF